MDKSEDIYDEKRIVFIQKLGGSTESENKWDRNESLNDEKSPLEVSSSSASSLASPCFRERVECSDMLTPPSRNNRNRSKTFQQKFSYKEEEGVEKKRNSEVWTPNNPPLEENVVHDSANSPCIQICNEYDEIINVGESSPLEMQTGDSKSEGIAAVTNEDARHEKSSKARGVNLSFEELTGGLPETTIEDKKNTLYFRDGKRRIDLILVYENENAQTGVMNENEYMQLEYRKIFQQSLMEQGLELETEYQEVSYDQKTCFVKVHAAYPVIEKHARIMRMKRPIKKFVSLSVNAWEGKEEIEFEKEGLCYPIFKWFRLNSGRFDHNSSIHTSIFGDDGDDQLMIKDRELYYTSAQRSQIVWQILLRAKYGEKPHMIGIRRLLNNKTYVSAYPLHEGKYNKESECGILYDRRRLYLDWARPSKWYKYQPLWLVRKYFGDKIALYFAWLGFYTEMLILPSIVGLICFIYGLSSMNSPENIPSKEICDNKIAGNITLCPLCDTSCKYQKLGDSCIFSNMTYLFDNSSTVFFSIFMSFWATSFLEMWKRRQAVISWQWDLQGGVDDEETRPEYETSVKMFKINPVTRRQEPYTPMWKKIAQLVVSVTVVLFMILIVLIAVVGTIIFRLTAFGRLNDSDNLFIRKHAKWITAIMAAFLNLSLIMVLTKIYHHVALWLTTKENPRANTDYERSFIVKIFLFEFMNYYSSLIYIAFFKGRFFTHPGDADARSSLILRLKGDVCDPAGCLSELCIQLAIIMIGKQCFNNLLELGFPALRNWWRDRVHKSAKIDPNKEYTHWEENYNLQDPGKLALFEEYLEMVIQYGFVTLFVAAFPLAPLFALLNNICEIRLDAYKYVAQSRRPLAERVENIGAWYQVLRGITYCAVIFNAFVISFTSDYIPRKIYQYFYSKNNDLVGYIDSSLSVFNTSDFGNVTSFDKRSKGMYRDPETCQYRGYRNEPDNPEYPYGLSPQYWHIFAARLVFVLIFEHLVFALTAIISNIIPNVPYQIGRQIQLEKLLQKERSSGKTDSAGGGGSGGGVGSSRGNAGGDKVSDDYDQLLRAIKDAKNSTKIGDIIEKGVWARKMSRLSVNVSTAASSAVFTAGENGHASQQAEFN